MWSAIACQAAPASPAITAAAIAAWSSSMSCAQLERIDAQEHVGTDDVSDGPDDEGEHAVVGEIGDAEMQAVRVRHVGRARSPVVEVRAVQRRARRRSRGDRDSGAASSAASGSSIRHARNSSSYVAPGELEVERHRATEVRRLGAADDRPAVRPAPDADDALRLEQAERFAKGFAAHPVVLDHLGLQRQASSGLEAMIDDVSDDRERDDLRRLPHRPLADGGNGERFGCVLHVSGRKRWLPHSAPLRVARL